MIFFKMGLIYTYESRSDFGMKIRDNIAVVIADGVECKDMMIIRIVHIFVIFITSHESPATVRIPFCWLFAEHVADFVAFFCDLEETYITRQLVSVDRKESWEMAHANEGFSQMTLADFGIG